LYHHQARAWKQGAPASRIINGYGPTETTIVCTSYEWTEAALIEGGIVPIGKPFEDMKYLIVDTDKYGGDKGELCLTGPQVFESYCGKADDNKFFTQDNDTYYRTGDLVSVGKDGNLLFHGRKDFQFKINGYRVEAAEVEKAIYSLIQAPAIILCVREQGISRLIAFCEKDPGQDVRGRLAQLLPAYMIPSEFITVGAYPLSRNGKIDRAQLTRMYNERLAVK
jgi:D-alanine--poly(phosphoribitol) ligase subunit 1